MQKEISAHYEGPWTQKAVRELLELIKTDIGESTALVSYTNDLEEPKR